MENCYFLNIQESVLGVIKNCFHPFFLVGQQETFSPKNRNVFTFNKRRRKINNKHTKHKKENFPCFDNFPLTFFTLQVLFAFMLPSNHLMGVVVVVDFDALFQPKRVKILTQINSTLKTWKYFTLLVFLIFHSHTNLFSLLFSQIIFLISPTALEWWSVVFRLNFTAFHEAPINFPLGKHFESHFEPIKCDVMRWLMGKLLSFSEDYLGSLKKLNGTALTSSAGVRKQGMRNVYLLSKRKVPRVLCK